jgi:hypothetical protein
MKRSVFTALIIIVCISCNNNSTPSSATVDSTSDVDNTNVKNAPAVVSNTDTLTNKSDTSKHYFADLADWEIDEASFNRMVANHGKCPFSDNSLCKIKKHNNLKGALKKIKKDYPELDWNYEEVEARFDASDIPRYKKTRKRKDPRNEEVAGYATKLIKVSSKDKKRTSEVHYFDICMICPPPNTGTCDIDEPVVSLNKK